MQKICSDYDFSGGWDGDWFYFPEEKLYRRLKNGTMRGRVSGEQIPDYDMMAAKRSEMGLRPPTKAVKALWEHWNATKQITH